jgi:uncharacterized metal-binding protein YceD (DUF177 family)
MTAPPPEFSRIVRLDQMGKALTGQTIRPTEAERMALARRFGLIALDKMEADYLLSEEDGALVARGRLRASLSQPCVATGEAVPEEIDTAFAIRFLPENAAAVDEEIELDGDDCDTVFYTGGIIDVGEAVAETLALAMTPYPRSINADDYLKDMGVISEEQAGPFAALLALKNQKRAK